MAQRVPDKPGLPGFVLADLLLLSGTFAATITAFSEDSLHLVASPSQAVSLGVAVVGYLLAFFVVGLHRHSPAEVNPGFYLRLATATLVPSLLLLTLTYAVPPDSLLAGKLLLLHGLLSLAVLLGYRVAWKQAVRGRIAPPGSQDALLTALVNRIPVANLIQRKPLTLNAPDIRDYLAGRTVLVTGAGGSIGSELSRQLLALRPFRLVLVDMNEFNLFQLETALRKVPFEGALEFMLADVRDHESMNALFSRFRPDIVLHTAAYKHVPLMERHPIEAFRNNTLATVQLLQLSARFDVEQFVFVSTDKAVHPTSVLGATKRLAEWYIQAYSCSVMRKMVRFGNVLASQGSVVPLFIQQITEGEMLTVTHPEMERYFMSAEEACILILSTLLLDAAPVYFFEMGRPIRITWLAEQLIRLLRPNAEPSQYIQYTGIRPGEKLHESLWEDTETPVPTAHPNITGLQQHRIHSQASLEAHLGYLESLCKRGESAALRHELLESSIPDVPGHLKRVASNS